MQNVRTDKMSSLELRQDKVLEQLKALKTKLTSCHAELGICAKPFQPPQQQQQKAQQKSGTTTTTKQAAVQPTVVIKQRPINVRQ